MQYIYLVRNDRTGQYLNQKGSWSRNLLSYRLAEFETEELAKAAMPSGVKCLVTRREKKELDTTGKYKFFLKDLKTKCYLNSLDQFKVWAPMASAVAFNTEAEALDKAESLSLDLDSISVLKMPIFEEVTQGPATDE